MAESEWSKSLRAGFRYLDIEEKKHELANKIADAIVDMLPDILELAKLVSEDNDNG